MKEEEEGQSSENAFYRAWMIIRGNVNALTW